MSRMQKTDLETWEEIGQLTREMNNERCGDLLKLFKAQGDVPKTIYGDQLRRIDGALTKLRSELEERMESEHGPGYEQSAWDDMPTQAPVHVFYSDDERPLTQPETYTGTGSDD